MKNKQLMMYAAAALAAYFGWQWFQKRKLASGVSSALQSTTSSQSQFMMPSV